MENPPQGESGCDGDEYSHIQEIRFIEFLDYVCQNEEQGSSYENHMARQESTGDQEVSRDHESRQYGRVYVRRNRIVDSKKTNLDPPTYQDFPNDPSLMINEQSKFDENCHEVPHEDSLNND